MSKKILFLDDDASRHRSFRRVHIGHNVTFTWSCTEACPLLAATVYDEAYLDHDLTEGPTFDGKDGRDVERFIVELAPEQRPRRVIIHSFNEMYRIEMGRILADAGVKVMIWPFDEMMMELNRKGDAQ